MHEIANEERTGGACLAMSFQGVKKKQNRRGTSRKRSRTTSYPGAGNSALVTDVGKSLVLSAFKEPLTRDDGTTHSSGPCVPRHRLDGPRYPHPHGTALRLQAEGARRSQRTDNRAEPAEGALRSHMYVISRDPALSTTHGHLRI